jgi:hypothetical protein
MLYAAMFDHVSLPAKLSFEKEDVGHLPQAARVDKIILFIKLLTFILFWSFDPSDYWSNLTYKYRLHVQMLPMHDVSALL